MSKSIRDTSEEGIEREANYIILVYTNIPVPIPRNIANTRLSELIVEFLYKEIIITSI